MRKSKTKSLGLKEISVFLVVILLIGIFLNYVDINISKESDTELFLLSYDTKVGLNDNICFTYSLLKDKEHVDTNFTLYVNNFDVRLPTTSEEVCAGKHMLREGRNFIAMRLSEINNNQSVFFNAERSENITEKNTVYFTTPPGMATMLQPVPPREINPTLMFFSAIFVFFIPGFFFTVWFFAKRQKEYDFASFFATVIAFSIALIVMLFWIFDALNILNVSSLLISAAAVSILFFALSFDKIKKLKIKLERKYFYIMIIFIAIVLLSHLYFQTYNSPWSVYYERQAEQMYLEGGWHNFDEFSYLGRNFTYVPGYMFLRAPYSWFAQTAPQDSVFVFMLIGNLFFLCSLLMLSKTLDFNFTKTLILVIFFYSSVFIFGWLSISMLHLFSFSLFLVAVSLALRGSMLTPLILAVSALFHALSLLLFPLIVFALCKKTDWKKLVMFTVIAAFILLLIYYPVIEKNGMPTEIQKEKWGYFIRGDVLSLGTMTAGITSLAVLPALFFAFRRRQNLKIASIVVLLVIAFMLLSYRVNIPLTVIAGVFLAMMISKNKTLKSLEVGIIILFFIMSLGLSLWVYNAETGGPQILNPFIYANSVYTTNSNFLVEPFYGHTAAYFTKRPILADLYVEYAIDEQYTDAIDFIATGDRTILDRWNIDFVITMRKERIVGIKEFIRPDEEIEYLDLDKIYSNNKFNIHYYR